MDGEKKKNTGAVQPQNNEKLSRREAMKRIARGIALVGTLGVTGVVTQGQDECYSYANGYTNSYYAYYNYGNQYNEYNAHYYDYFYHDNIYLDYYDYHNYLDAYYYANGY
jgi:hypothetical protein